MWAESHHDMHARAPTETKDHRISGMSTNRPPAAGAVTLLACRTGPAGIHRSQEHCVINGPEPLPTGQEFEAELLIAATTSTERGFGGMLVLGESGSGKTTLLHAAAAAARNRGTVVLEARGHAADRDVPLGCVSGL